MATDIGTGTRLPGGADDSQGYIITVNLEIKRWLRKINICALEIGNWSYEWQVTLLQLVTTE